MKNRWLIPFSLATVVVLFYIPHSAFGQSILDSAGNFTILGGAAVTSTGAAGTTISGGNVGSAAAVTGFPPAVVTGGGSVTIDTTLVGPALAALAKAAEGLANMAPSADLSSQNLGGMTLLPGIYSFSSTATLDGALTLNANGENNAVWVFQIGSSFTSTLGSTVTLINPGSALGSDDGVFWDAIAAISIGADNTILGNYLAGTSITLGTNASGSGRALAQAGVTLDVNSINSDGGPEDSDWSSGVKYYSPSSSVVVLVPEPAAFLWLAPLGALGLAFWRRRTLMNKAQPVKTDGKILHGRKNPSGVVLAQITR